MVSHWKLFLAIHLLGLSLFTYSSAQPTTVSRSEVKFEKQTIKLAGKKIVVEIAKDDNQRQQGLMFRKSMPANEGMLFIFDNEQTLSFWMKNTLIDLSIGYFDKNKVLVDIQEMVPLSPMEARPTTYPSLKPAMYALEMNKGWFKKNKIKIGHKFEFESR